MNPVLALGLVAAAGLAMTRLPRVPVRRPPHVDLVFAAGAPLVLLGVLLGPGIGVLEPRVLRALAPVTALAIGWIGAVLGARFEWRVVRRIPLRVWALALLQGAAGFGAVAVTAWLLAGAVPALRDAWSPTLPAVLTLGAVAAMSGPGAVALVAHAVGIRRVVARALALAAALDTAFGALAFTIALALYHPRDPVGGTVLGWHTWLALALASGAVVGMLFLSLARLRRSADGLTLSLLGAMLFGAGVGYAADLSPFVVCALAAALIVNVSPDRRRAQRLLHDWEHPIYAVLLIVAGALLRLPTAWLIVVVPLLAAARVLAKWAAVRFGRGPLRVTDLPPHSGVATAAQGGAALAVAINFYITYGGAPAAALVTTVILGIGIAQMAAPALMLLALRPASPGPLPSTPAEVT